MSLKPPVSRLWALTLVFVAFAAGPSRAEILVYTAELDGANQVPPVATGASGSVVLTLDTDTQQGSYTLEFSGLSSPQTGAHFHMGAAGQDGTLLHALALRTPSSGVWDMTAEEIGWLAAGLVYINVHSQFHPAGEMRGQLQLSGPVADETTSFGALKAAYR